MAFFVQRAAPPDSRSHLKLDIVLDADFVELHDDGQPARLSGHVLLQLPENTSVKEIALHLKGKAHLPSVQQDGPGLSYTVCTHDWSFLEGGNKHSHTLKAGHHCFPFQVQLGGDLPSSFSTTSFGSVSVAYKLRATVVRASVLSHNLNVVKPVFLVRSFPAQSLEYQQSLEMENMWPDKFMYSVSIPHKAWAIGDTAISLLHITPLAKVKVTKVVTSIQESVKLSLGPFGYSEHEKVSATSKHEIVDGRAVLVEENGKKINTPRPSSSAEDVMSEGDMTTFKLPVSLQLSMLPSLGQDPFIVKHRIRWSISVLNPDGHTSELRCSLPIHILDHCLLHQSRGFSLATRRLLLGEDAVPEIQASEPPTDLPSYNAHIHDRPANMFLSDAAVIRVSNPWVVNNTSPVLSEESIRPDSPSDFTATPVRCNTDAPSTPSLEWVNSELLLSLSDRFISNVPSREQFEHEETASTTPAHSPETSARPSRAPSPGPSQPPVNNQDVYIHSHNNASRGLASILKANLKPQGLTPAGWFLGRASNPHTPMSTPSPVFQPSPNNIPIPNLNSRLLHRAFTTVPDYGIASRGFLGGIPPLSTMQDLPSYEEAEHI